MDQREQQRYRLALGAVVAVGAIVVLGAVLAAVRRDSGPPPDDRSTFAGAVLPPNVRAPKFALRDQDGEVVRMEALRGKVVLAAFVYSTCTESCGPQVQLMRGALDDLSEDIPALAISVDPANDTPASARRFLLDQRVTGRVRFLLGPADQLRPVHRGFFVQPQSESTEHQARLVLIDRRGMQRVGYTVHNTTAEQIARDIKVLRDERS